MVNINYFCIKVLKMVQKYFVNLIRLVASLISKINFKKTLIVTSIVFVSLLIVLLIFRGAIARELLNKRINSFNKHYQAELKVGDFHFSGLSAIELNNISLKAINNDTLLTIGSVYAKVDFWKLFIFKVALTDFELINANISLVKEDTVNNWNFLIKKENNDTTDENKLKDKDYASKVNSILNAIFNKIPLNIKILQFNINALLDGYRVMVVLPELTINHHTFNTNIYIKEKGNESKWVIAGSLQPADNIADFKIFSSDKNKVNIPYITHKWNWMFAFDTVHFSFSGNKLSHGIASFEGSSSINGLVINHTRISIADVFLNNASIDYKINVGSNYFELDSNSLIVFNKLTVNPYICYRPSPTRQLTFKIHKDKFPSNDLFQSLPKGLFTNLEGMQTKGDLSYHLDFFVDIDHPDSIIFDSDLKRYYFFIEKYGNTNFTKLNEPFVYTAYEKGVPVRSLIVGTENPNFRRLNEISDYLKNCVLISEDAGFFWHRGFLPESFKEAITKDIKTKRFARGGSTISMQLVKNVFLNRNKTIARKIEEALIVWLIENNGLSTKQRMYEVYLNIIEWGPNVYGANEAARFYFNKDAAHLTLSESLFLASLIPHPKWFRYSFDEKGNLKPFLSNYFSFASNRLLRKEMINQQDFDNLRPNVDPKGPARFLIIKTDSVPVETEDFHDNF